MDSISLRLRSPIFDHGVLGVPIRHAVRRGSGKEDIELSEFKSIEAALKATLSGPSIGRDEWRVFAKEVSPVVR